MPLQKPVSQLEESGRVHITVPARKKERRKMFRKMPMAVDGYAPICCDTNDPVTQADGLRKRLLVDLPQAEPEAMKEFRAFTKQWISEHLTPLVWRPRFHEWLDSTNYSMGRKQELIHAFESLHGGTPKMKDCRKVNSFGKTESYPTYKFMRWINSRNDRVKVWFGPLIKAIEAEVYKQPWFIKHTPVAERPAALEALKRDGCKYFLTDYTSWEAAFVPELMDICELELYDHMLQHVTDPSERKKYRDMLTGVNKLRTRIGVAVDVEGKRMSGDMCTSLGNGFTNLMATLFIAHKKGFYVNGFVEGDDGIFACSGKLTPQDYRELGLLIKIVEVVDPCTMVPVNPCPSRTGVNPGAAFCGIICSETGQIIRDPRRFVAEFGWTSACIHGGDTVIASLQRAKALSAVYETPHCPVLGELARLALRKTRGAVPRFVEDGFHTCPKDETRPPPFSPDPETRELFATQFGVSVQDQLLLEARFRRGDLKVMDVMEPTSDMLHYVARYVEAT